jgi:hypothetical protein
VSVVTVLHRRFSAYAASWPEPTLQGLGQYSGGNVRQRRRPRPHEDRYWTLIPRAICEAWAPTRRAARSRFLNDVLWGQYCVFLCVRIHDDLLDGQLPQRNLVFVADDLLLESQRAFAVHLNTLSFRALFARHLRATLRAIVAVDALQARPGGMTRARLRLHARVSSVFNLAAAAACLECRRPAMIRRFERVYASLAVAGQLIDDLSDVEEDLARRRYNFVANVLDGRRSPASHDRRQHPARAVLRDNAIDKVLALARAYVARAAASAAAARIPEIDAYLSVYLAEIDRRRDAVHRMRVAHVFGRSLA